MKKFIFPLIIALAFLLRFWRFPQYFVFSLEENNILYVLEKFVSGNWSPLLGAEATGYVHHLFLPPLHLYIFSLIFKIVGGEPLAFGYLEIFLGTLSVVLWYLIGLRIKNFRFGLIAAFITAVSFQLISIDRSAWTGGLIPFAITLTIYLFVSALKTKKVGWLIALGLSLGFDLSLHYQSLVVIFLILASSIFLLKKKTWFIFLSFLLTLAPLIIFDLRHNFFNLYGLFLALSTLIAGKSPYSSSHFLFFLYPAVIFISAFILSKLPKILAVIILIIYLIIQFNNFVHYPVLNSYPLKNSLANQILDNYHGTNLTIFFKGKGSFEYRYLLFLRAKNRGIDTRTINVLEPWDNPATTKLVIEKDTITQL